MKIGSKQQSLSLPMNLDSLIPNDHKVRYVSKFVDQLDLSCIENQYKEMQDIIEGSNKSLNIMKKVANKLMFTTFRIYIKSF